MTLSLRERRRQMLRDEIILAAQDLMIEKGHDAMSMDELASRAGISKTTLYSYFATKDELIIAAAVLTMNELLEVLEDKHEGLTPLQRLARLLSTIVQKQINQTTMEPRPWRSELFQFLCTHAESLALLQRLDEAVVSLTQEALAQKEIRPELDLATVVRLFYAFTHALNEGLFSIGGTPNLHTFPDHITTVFVQGVGAHHSQPWSLSDSYHSNSDPSVLHAE